MESQLFGRAGKSFLTAFAKLHAGGKNWTEQAASALKQLVKWLTTARPRFLDCDLSVPTVVIFTDGACEGFLDTSVRPTTAIGLVLFDN